MALCFWSKTPNVTPYIFWYRHNVCVSGDGKPNGCETFNIHIEKQPIFQ